MFINQDKINFFERKKEKTLKSIWKSIIQYNKTLSLSLFRSLSLSFAPSLRNEE